LRASELDYELPEELIAQRPAEPRDSSRLMVLDSRAGSLEHHAFHELPRFLRPGDALVLNETKVLPARLIAHRPGGGRVELLFLRETGEYWEALARPSKRLRPGMDLLADGEQVRVVEALGEGRWLLSVPDGRRFLERRGEMPLPPYIKSTPEARDAYQTVYARNPGSAAAPTAGFHFTDRTLREAGEAGAAVARITLHVGTGTFSPIRTEKVEEHRMHTEHYSISGEAARTIESAERVLAVGTTVARTLETWAATGEREGESGIFIYPGYRWQMVDALLTNFHLPRSTLLALVMSFGGVDLVREAYRVAVQDRYRFYSFGDAMLLLNGGRGR
jgi:S-adenosylmethionine:tRNA ribosyltransferase-isomerase